LNAARGIIEEIVQRENDSPYLYVSLNVNGLKLQTRVVRKANQWLKLSVGKPVYLQFSRLQQVH
jgi:ABC-type molybdate transport system ATPase subunit